MTTYYDDRSVQITAEEIRIAGNRYRLADCTQIWHRRGGRSWRVLTRRIALGAALAGPIVAAALGLLIALTRPASLTVTVAIIGASVLTGLAVGPLADLLFEHLDRSYAKGSRRLEIWAHWQGRPVCLLRTDDALRFGQIYRALQRALEGHQPTDHH